ncbi:diguanylate cyclase/phosphodiesterase (GGDEF & EAL domains) with PAS/PAC sensor(s) [hydrothermal vent metagenome]|uniref:histidine kinase n=1 Tax=hydrothermal vent metagenome TaxID=652676 RepID=A0A3B0XN50_9ZZZZ
MKQLIQHLQIRHKLIIIIMSTVIFTLLLVGSALVISERYSARESMLNQLMTVSSIIGDRSTAALSFDDQRVALEVLSALDHESSVVLACIYDDTQSLFASHARHNTPAPSLLDEQQSNSAPLSENTLTTCPAKPLVDSHRFRGDNFELFQTIRLEGEAIGTVYIRATLNELNKRVIQFILLVISMTFSAGLVAWFLASKQQAIISKPILDLATFARRISIEADYTARLPLGANDEIGTLNRSFNDMLEQIHQRQLARDIAELALSEREQDLRVTLNSIGDAVIVTDINGKITRMNPVAEHLTGWSFEQAQKHSLKTVFPIIDATTRKPIDNPVEKVIRSGETVFLSNHTTLVAKDGSELQIADSAAPIRNTDNKILGLILVFNDVTEQYHLREAAAKSERDLQAIMSNSPAAIYVIDNKGYFSFINQQFENFFHVRRKEVAGRTLSDIFPQDIAQILHKNNTHVLSTNQPMETEEVLIQAGALHTYASIKFPLFNEDNKAYAVCSISTDITEKRQQEEQLRRSQKMDALGKLTGGIAHDYNNLLGIIMGYAELLNDQLTDNPLLSKYTLDITRAAKRGSALTQKLLAFTRHKSADANQTNINALLKEQQFMLEKTLTARITLVLDLEPALWPVRIDSGDLEDAIINLSINASHAIDGNGQLTLRTHNEQLDKLDAQTQQLPPGDYILLSVTDTGRGMDENTREKIFDPFFSTKGEQGTGLGLSQVYGFVKRSKGEIKVYSEPGQGSRFALYFPRSKQTDTPVQVTDRVDKKRNLLGHETLLVVDDEPDLVELASNILSTHGYQVHSAISAKQALSILEKTHIDLMISDVIMPVMDGYQLAALVQKKYPHIRIQMASGFADDRHNITANISNALHQNLLYKPYTSTTLLVHVRDLLDDVGPPLTGNENSAQNTPADKSSSTLIKNSDINNKHIADRPSDRQGDRPSDRPTSPDTTITGGTLSRTILIMDDEVDVRELLTLNLKRLGYHTIPVSNSDEAIARYQSSLQNNQTIDAVILDLNIPGSMGGSEVAMKIRELHTEAVIIVSSGDSSCPEMTDCQDHGFDGALEKTFIREKIKQLLDEVLKPG